MIPSEVADLRDILMASGIEGEKALRVAWDIYRRFVKNGELAQTQVALFNATVKWAKDTVRAETAEAERDALKLRVVELEAVLPDLAVVRSQNDNGSTERLCVICGACDSDIDPDLEHEIGCLIHPSPKPTEGRGTSDAQRDPAIPAYMQDDDLDDR